MAATALKSVVNERILAYNGSSSWNSLRQEIRELRPDLVSGSDEDVEGMEISDASVDIRRAEDILKSIGRPGFVKRIDTLCDFLDSAY